MIEVSGLCKRYGSVDALSDVSFKVEKGQIVGFLGANGAGKTTTMDIMCGCIGADGGTARIADIDITERPLEAKRRLGYLPDVAPLHPEMRVLDYVKYAAAIHGVPRQSMRQRVDETLEQLSLGDVRQRLVGNLSKGYRQRVALAQAIVHDPEVLVLDEPTEGLDPNQIVHIRELIKSLAGRHTIILSSHILSEVQNTCDHLVIIHKGRIVQQGTYEELVRNLQTGRVYRLRVGRDAAQVVRLLGAVSGVIAPKVLDETDIHGAKTRSPYAAEIEFGLGTGTDETVLDQVARQVVDGGFGLRELVAKTKTLEEVFYQLTN